MDDLTRYANKLAAFDLHLLLRKVWERREVQDYITKLNTEGLPTSQLYEQGVTAGGQDLGDYTEFSIFLKETGTGDKRIDHITLKDTGDFYRSFIVSAFNAGFRIDANPIKEDTDLTLRFGRDIIGLSESNIILLIEFIRPFFIAEAKAFLP